MERGRLAERSVSPPRLAAVMLVARLRSLRRFLAAHGFTLFILGPLIIGSGLWIAKGYFHLLRDSLVGLLAGDMSGVFVLSLTLLLSALALPACQREIFPIRAAEGYLDALPIPESARFHVALVACWTRQLPIAAILVVLLAVLSEEASLLALAGWALRILAAFVPLTLIGMSAVQLRVRSAGSGLGVLAGPGVLAGLGVLLITILLLTPAHRLSILLPWWTSATQIRIVLGQALAVPVRFEGEALGLVVTTILLYMLAFGLFWRFRRRDLERARALAWPSPRSRRSPRIKRRPLSKPSPWKRPGMWVQVRRDLVLIARRFSPAVYLVTGLTLVILAGAFLILPGLGFDFEWTRRAVVFASAGAALSQVSLVPLLLKHQLPRFWMEKSSGVDPEEVWGAKLWLARILALPAVMLAGALLWTLPQASANPALIGLALVQLLAVAWVVASTVGYTAFEIAAQPVLGLIFSSLVGMALGGLFVFKASAWWLWGPFYLILASKLAERASRRIRFTEVES